MKRILPDSLAAWALLIIIGALIVTQVSTLAAVLQSRAATGRMIGFFHFAERVSSIGRAIIDDEPDQRSALANSLSDPTLTVRIQSAPLANAEIAGSDELAELEDILESRLANSGVIDVHVERRQRIFPAATDPSQASDDDAGPIERTFTDIAETYANSDSYIASLQLADGSWLNFVTAIPPSLDMRSGNALVLSLIAIAVTLGGSIWSLRRLTSPYKILADAAERLGRDLNTPPLSEEGPREIRAASHALNLMQARLNRVLQDRDQLAAAIAHDLRTPVTRLRLRAEFIEDSEQRDRMLADLDEIEMMTKSVLTFARDAAQAEPRRPVDLISLIQTLCEENRHASFLSSGLPARLPYVAEPVALQRAISNLIDNAVRYGHSAKVSLVVANSEIRVVIDDQGPGIPPGALEDVFRPFQRLETSRNRDTGGTGLGLTIARSVARGHGGDVILGNREGGGLRAELVLPRSS